jgi:DNA-binding XRE family transcriptional regulator
MRKLLRPPWMRHRGVALYEVLDISEDDAFELAIDLNEARRQLSPEQLKELRKEKEKVRKDRKKKALELRNAAGATQEEAAKAVGVARRTVDKWEEGSNVTDEEGDITSAPDCRTKVPPSHHAVIYERFVNGEAAKEIAADYKVEAKTIRNIIKKVRKKALELRKTGATQEEAAEAVGVDQSTIVRWEGTNMQEEEMHITSAPDCRTKVPPSKSATAIE